MDINNSRASPVSICQSSSEEIDSPDEASTHQIDEGAEEVVTPIHEAVADGNQKWQDVPPSEPIPPYNRVRSTASESSSSSGSCCEPVEEESVNAMKVDRAQTTPEVVGERLLEFPKFDSDLSSPEGKEILHKIILPLISHRLKEVLQVMGIPKEELDHWGNCSEADSWRNAFEGGDRPCKDWVALLDAVTKVFNQEFARSAANVIKQNESGILRQRYSPGVNLEQQRALEDTNCQLRSSLEQAHKKMEDLEAEIARLQMGGSGEKKNQPRRFRPPTRKVSSSGPKIMKRTS